MTELPVLSTSTEDYLEAILRLIGAKGAARVRDIAAVLSLHKSTVSSALKGLSEKGLVEYSRYEITTLTELGKEIAQEVNRRHEVLRRFLAEVLDIPGDMAERNACRMEHVVDAEVLQRIACLTQLLQEDSSQACVWREKFHRECRRQRAVKGEAKEDRQP